MDVPSRVDLLFDFVHGFFVKIGPVDNDARLICHEMSFFGAQGERVSARESE